MSAYNLVFIENETNKIFHGKRLMEGLYKIIEPMTGETEELTKHGLRKRFSSDVRNGKSKQEEIRKCKSIYHFQ